MAIEIFNNIEAQSHIRILTPILVTRERDYDFWDVHHMV